MRRFSLMIVLAGLLVAVPSPSQSGIGSLDLLALSDPNSSAAGVIRVFNEAGAAGTSGFTESSEGFLDQNRSGIPICPADPSLQRFNVGVRTMEQGATVQVTVRDGSGHIISQFTRSYDPTYFDQTDVAAFPGGVATPGNSTITVHVVSGSLYLYGVSADNRTNDPSFQPASD